MSTAQHGNDGKQAICLDLLPTMVQGRSVMGDIVLQELACSDV